MKNIEQKMIASLENQVSISSNGTPVFFSSVPGLANGISKMLNNAMNPNRGPNGRHR